MPKSVSMIDELVSAVASSAELSDERASKAVGSMLRFLGARLPSPLFGELQARLNVQVETVDSPSGGPDDARRRRGDAPEPGE
jgi:hypothetical protein